MQRRLQAPSGERRTLLLVNDAYERRAFVVVLAAVLLTSAALGLLTGGNADWHVVARMLAGLALLGAILLGIGTLVGEEVGRRLPAKRSLVLGAAAAVGIGVLLIGVLLVAGTLDALDQNDFQ